MSVNALRRGLARIGGEGRCSRGDATGRCVRSGARRREERDEGRVSKLMARAATACRRNRVHGRKDVVGRFGHLAQKG